MFRFLGVVIVGALVIVGGSRIDVWAGLAATVLVLAGMVWWLRRKPPAS